MGKPMIRTAPRAARQAAFILVWALLLLGAAAGFGGATASGQADDGGNFVADNALTHATYLASVIGARPAGSLGEQEAAGWLAGQFAALGYAVRVQPFTFTRAGQPIVGMNVIATKPGLRDYGAIYVGAHYDTVGFAPDIYGGPGAIDNASGVGVMLEGARLAATTFYSPTLNFIAFGAEEDYLVGSAHYVAQLPVRERVGAVGMLNLDCVGWGDVFNLIIAREVDRPFAESLAVDPDWIGRATFGASDHISFATVNIPAAFFNMARDGMPCGPGYHQQTDTADLLELPALQRSGAALVTALGSLAARSTPVHEVFLPLAFR